MLQNLEYILSNCQLLCSTSERSTGLNDVSQKYDTDGGDDNVEEIDEEESASVSVFMPKWKKKENVFDYSFVEDVGPVIEIVDQSELLEVTEGEVFNTLVGEDLFELMVFQINLNTTQKHKPFTPTNLKEIKSFIAVNFLMGIYQNHAFV